MCGKEDMSNEIHPISVYITVSEACSIIFDAGVLFLPFDPILRIALQDLLATTSAIFLSLFLNFVANRSFRLCSEMTDNEEGREATLRGNDWEVVSFTASAYASSPGPKQVESNQDRLDGAHEAETSSSTFMSGHFIFPPSQHENLPLEPEYAEMHNGSGSEDVFSQLAKEEDNMSIRGVMSNEFPGIQIFDEKGNALSVSGADLNIYSISEFSSFHSESSNKEEAEGEGADNSIDFQKPIEGDRCDGADLPCEAWWKRRIVSLYARAKEANTLWSIFITTAVMGLLIVGHQWQQERWQVLHLKWQYGINDERIGRLLGPLSRFKDLIIGGHNRRSLLRGSTSAEHRL